MINIIIKDTTIKEDIDEKDDKPQQCSNQQNHLAKQLPRKLSSPRQDGISQHHRLFKMCISCNADHRPTISFAPPHPLKVGITVQVVHSCQSERINKIDFLFTDCGDWYHRAHHTTKCSQQLQQESKTYVHTIKKSESNIQWTRAK